MTLKCPVTFNTALNMPSSFMMIGDGYILGSFGKRCLLSVIEEYDIDDVIVIG